LLTLKLLRKRKKRTFSRVFSTIYIQLELSCRVIDGFMCNPVWYIIVENIFSQRPQNRPMTLNSPVRGTRRGHFRPKINEFYVYLEVWEPSWRLVYTPGSFYCYLLQGKSSYMTQKLARDGYVTPFFCWAARGLTPPSNPRFRGGTPPSGTPRSVF
jgi:hypothetical protein